jgi:thioredoxin family protein
MLTVSCPKCGSKNRAPEELLGETVKCGKCGHAFVVDSDAATNSGQAPGPAASREPSPPPIPRLAQRPANTWREDLPVESPEDRYPWLMRYLLFIKGVAFLAGAIGCLVGIFTMITGGGLATDPAVKSDHGGTALFFYGILIIGASGLWVVGTLAAVQFIHVIVDIQQGIQILVDRSIVDRT